MSTAASELIVVHADPLCAESPLELQEGIITPTPRFYVRNNFPIPRPPTRLTITGALAAPQTLNLHALRRLPRRRLTVTLECAGNGRAFVHPAVPGEPWKLGAVSTAEWEGVPLAAVLQRARPLSQAVEVLFIGADGFARSLPMEQARDDDVLIVDTMNGTPLTHGHGAPIRLLVPGWYGMASVKWLERIEALRTPFRGHFQVERYVIGDQPVRDIQPRAIVLHPSDDAQVPLIRQSVRGLAWAGIARISSVSISDDAGASWAEARLIGISQKYAWTEWEATWQPRAAGQAILMARAVDCDGRQQPLQPVWNALGYANNGVLPVRVAVG